GQAAGCPVHLAARRGDDLAAAPGAVPGQTGRAAAVKVWSRARDSRYSPTVSGTVEIHQFRGTIRKPTRTLLACPTSNRACSSTRPPYQQTAGASAVTWTRWS